MQKWLGLILALLLLSPSGVVRAGTDETDDRSTLTAKATVEEVVEDEAGDQEIAEDFDSLAWETTLGNDDESAEQQ